jgi:two-component system chemotaxis response regulator CheB
VGASAGGVEALKILVSRLPRNLQAAIFVVLHIGRGINGQSYLPEILAQAGPFRAIHPVDGQAIEYGTIYVAPPDKHLLISKGHVHLWHGPKVNLWRPAIDLMFRTAACNYGGRFAGVILSGMLYDGVAGLAAIKRRGGVAIVQNPGSAKFPDMPMNAMKHVPVDDILELDEIIETIPGLCSRARTHTIMETEQPHERTLIKWTCPECRGPLWEEREGDIVEYRCRVGHTYSPAALAAEHEQTVERTLWSSVVALEEAADITEQLGPELGPYVHGSAKKKREQAETIRKILEDSP